MRHLSPQTMVQKSGLSTCFSHSFRPFKNSAERTSNMWTSQIESIQRCHLWWSRGAIMGFLWSDHPPSPYSILLFRLILPLHDTPDPGAMWFDLGNVHMLLWCVNRTWGKQSEAKRTGVSGLPIFAVLIQWYKAVWEQSILSNGEVGVINHHQFAQTITKPVLQFWHCTFCTLDLLSSS